MKLFANSPLFRSLMCLNLLVGLSLFGANYWPLPQPLSTEGEQVSASDIADYLGEGDALLAETLERPLFHQNRRPPREVQKVQAPAPVVRKPRFVLQLVGVMGAASSDQTAFLLNTDSQATHTAKIGQIVDGWSVVSVDARTVTLTKDGEQKTLELN